VSDEPKIAFQSGRLRLVDSSGQSWTIYDCRRLNGRIRRTAPASEVATWRVFVASDGKRHAYRFRERESRELDPSLLAQQLSRAQWSRVFQPNRRSRR
jgi:hypothetical protein